MKSSTPLNQKDEYAIRKATPTDAVIIAGFNCALALETEDLRLDSGTVEKGVAAILGNSGKGLYFVAEADGQVVGQIMITYEWSDWRNGNIWWLQSVYVRKDFRGKGVFRGLFAYVQKLAFAELQVCGIRLYMHRENESARRAYNKLGFEATAYQVFELPL